MIWLPWIVGYDGKSQPDRNFMGQTYNCWSVYPRPLKKFMYKFHYKTMKQNFDWKLLCSNTESFVYEVQTEDFFADIES